MTKTNYIIYDQFKSFKDRRLDLSRLRGDNENWLSLEELTTQLLYLRTVVIASNRDPNCMNVKFNNKILRSVDIEDDGSSMDNMDVVLK